MFGKIFVALALYVGIVFTTYGTKEVFDAVSFKSHQNTDAMLREIEAAEVTYL